MIFYCMYLRDVGRQVPELIGVARRLYDYLLRRLGDLLRVGHHVALQADEAHKP